MARGKKSVVAAPNIELKETVATDSKETEEEQKILVETKEQSKRKATPVIEKAKESEKDLGPVIIFSFTDSSGRRQSKTFICASASLHTYMSEEFHKVTKKTKLTLNIDAEVLERI